MDPLHLSIALGPLAVYLLLIGMINLSRRPFVTTGARDLAALGVAVSGFVVAGPMELFLPDSTALLGGGPVTWLLLLALYGLCVTLLSLLARPRIVIYNVRPEKLRPILAHVVGQLDKDARWAGECLVLPNLGVQLHAEPFTPLKNAQLVSAGSRQNMAGWRRLETVLARELRESGSSPNRYGFLLCGLGVVVVAVIAYFMINHTSSVAHDLRDMLRL